MALVYSLVDETAFFNATSATNTFIIDTFGWLFSGGTLLMLLTCLALFFHPASRQKIGGADALPLLNRWQWFSIVLCTTIATGIIFWGTAEPVYHITSPPAFAKLPPNSDAAGNFAMSAMYLHWSFTPYAIYTVPAVVFALAFYNQKLPFSLQSTLFPFRGKRKNEWLGAGIDGICLYALIAGMAASLGAGILTLSGGVRYMSDREPDGLLAILTLLIVLSFVASAISGLMRGIRILSDINAKIFAGLTVFVFIFSDPLAILQLSADGLLTYFSSFFEYSTLSINHPNDPWPKSWTTFNWANWLAWAPITALFLGRLGYGYTVRQFLLFNWIIPSLFGIVWMSVFSGATVDMLLHEDIPLGNLLKTAGPESIVFKLFESLPLSNLVAGVFLFTAFLSYVTAADSNTEAMSGISSTGISPSSPTPPLFVKICWGLTIGAVAYVMVSMAGIKGVKMLSNLGGLPALFLILAITLGLIKLMLFNKKTEV